MRKKLKMRAGGKVKKYAEGGSVAGQRPTEDRARMAAEAAAGFDEEEARLLGRRRAPAPSLITNNRVGSNRAAGLTPVGSASAPALEVGGRTMAPFEPAAEVDGTGTGAVVRRVSAPTRARARPAARQRGPNADELNDREMTRLLNERSLEAARAGRSMFRKGGRVVAKKKK
jgi:hypothetical protein